MLYVYMFCSASQLLGMLRYTVVCIQSLSACVALLMAMVGEPHDD